MGHDSGMTSCFTAACVTISCSPLPPPSTSPSRRWPEQVIEELDEKKKSALKATWLKVNQDFGAIFSTLLPGTQVTTGVWGRSMCGQQMIGREGLGLTR